MSKTTVEARAINDPFIKKAREAADEAETTVDEARKQQQFTDKLVAEVTIAYNRSVAAVAEFDAIYRNASDKLERLDNFDKTANKRKEEALVQIAKIPEILTKIEDFRTKNEETLRDLADVEIKAQRSKATASDVKNLADSAKEVGQTGTEIGFDRVFS